jgi:hypothetical protein
MAAQLKVDVNVMPRIVFTGDSQTVGCVGAMDYAQMLSWEIPLRVFNRSVGGSNTTHLLSEFGGGTVTVKAGEKVVHGEGVGWWAGPYIGQKVRIGTQEYIVDSIEPLDYVKRLGNLHLTEPAREDYSGTDYKFEPGWRVRIADVRPQYACFMYTVNDAGRKPEDFKAQLAEITKRCREAGIQPLFLSGVPFMDAVSGGSHAGAVTYTAQRARDLEEFCQENKLPFGDVYRTLDLLDPQRTSVWADTIHPTNDGSIIAVHALRYLLKEMGALDNPYYVRGYRAPEAKLPHPQEAGLQPIATAQPRRDKNNRLAQEGHNLEAQRIRDEYGLIAEQDGQVLESKTPLVFRFGVGDPAKLQSAEAEIVLAAAGEVVVYSRSRKTWLPLVHGQGKLTAALPTPLADIALNSEIHLAVRGEQPAVDYVALNVTGDITPWQPPQSDRAIIWPTPGQFEWSQEGNLFPNGALTEAVGDKPAGWMRDGEGAVYLPAGVIATGTGHFPEPNGDKFRCAGAKFTQTVRPLDMLVIKAEVERGGNFLVEKVVDDETLDLRRSPKTALGDVAFEVTRRSGLRAVPEGCCIEVKEGSDWFTQLPLPKGRYRLGFFYRRYNPAGMNAHAFPSKGVVVVFEEGTFTSGRWMGQDLEASYVWLRGWVDYEKKRDGELVIGVTGQGPETMQYTGFSLERR